VELYIDQKAKQHNPAHLRLLKSTSGIFSQQIGLPIPVRYSADSETLFDPQVCRQNPKGHI
ncbi:MAG: hypothetical protein O2971_19405, partial [Proteobacteria bacterium]|nr:hypothetical protein [Pseudomonadota bacterium]